MKVSSLKALFLDVVIGAWIFGGIVIGGLGLTAVGTLWIFNNTQGSGVLGAIVVSLLTLSLSSMLIMNLFFRALKLFKRLGDSVYAEASHETRRLSKPTIKFLGISVLFGTLALLGLLTAQVWHIELGMWEGTGVAFLIAALLDLSLFGFMVFLEGKRATVE
jgi:hypothetical protein